MLWLKNILIERERENKNPKKRIFPSNFSEFIRIFSNFFEFFRSFSKTPSKTVFSSRIYSNFFHFLEFFRIYLETNQLEFFRIFSNFFELLAFFQQFVHFFWYSKNVWRWLRPIPVTSCAAFAKYRAMKRFATRVRRCPCNPAACLVNKE